MKFASLTGLLYYLSMKMDLIDLKKRIIEYAKAIGIDKVGFTEASVLSESIKYLQERDDRGFKFYTNKGEIEKKIDPFFHLPKAKSIIVIAVAYGGGAIGDKDPKHGYFARTSWGLDYHKVVLGLLQRLSAFIKAQLPETESLPMVDTGHLLEKTLAVRAGLGWIGKNSLLITPEYGSYVFLGLLLTNLSLPVDQPIANSCGNCNRCRENCPTGALEGENLNLDRCLANLCLYSDVIEEELRERFQYLYGCDNCQEICPHNKIEARKTHHDFKPKQGEFNPKLREIMELSNKEFKKRFGHLAGSWRGKRPILRNAILLAGNQRDETSIPNLRRLLRDPNPDIRATAAWALGKILDE